MLSVFPNVLVVNPSVPATTLEEFVRYAKANPGKLNFASSGYDVGHPVRFREFPAAHRHRRGARPYKGSAPAAQAMIAGEVAER